MAKQKKSKMALYTRQDKIILYCGYALLGLFLLAIIVPMIYIVIASFMDPVTLQNKGISFDFSKWSLDAYQRVVSDKQIWVGFKNAILYSIIFTIISVAVTMLAAYPMSLPDFKGKAIFNTLFVITMFFSGGLIPTYLLMLELGFMNNFLVYIIPGLFICYYMLLASSYIQNIPEALFESARIDGASELKTFVRIVIPLAMPMLACIAVYIGVGHWNSWFDVSLYSRDGTWDTLQIILYRLLNQANAKADITNQQQLYMSMRTIQPETVRAATTVVVVVPIIFIYPFFQRYFVGGITLGAVKG